MYSVKLGIALIVIEGEGVSKVHHTAIDQDSVGRGARLVFCFDGSVDQTHLGQRRVDAEAQCPGTRPLLRPMLYLFF